jgi:hypothetical protein
MRSFPATPKDNERNVGRYEFTGYDIDVIEEAIPKIAALKAFEESLELDAVLRSTTDDLLDILMAIRLGWESETVVTSHSSARDVQPAVE